MDVSSITPILYDTTPPSTNVKCLVFTGIVSFGYLFLPPKNKYLFAFFLYACYLAMAIYDYQYQCQKLKFGPTYLALFYSWLKPQHSDQILTYKSWAPYLKRRVLYVDLAVLAVIICLIPFFWRWQPNAEIYKALPEEERKQKIRRDNIIAGIVIVACLSIFAFLRLKYYA